MRPPPPDVRMRRADMQMRRAVAPTGGASFVRVRVRPASWTCPGPYQDYPFDHMVTHFFEGRDTSRPPIVQT
ncbi:hypothetical protein AB0O63_16250, partial [Streptomyces cyaneofuscatus]|uniref:hypothetical protein n=1 Tax=Streptomyces cyaneofuscatus TaxID=66883 RepID=UPI0034356A73